MKPLYDYLGMHFSGYMIFLILMSAYVLFFVDRGQFEKSKLKKEARFSAAAGIIYFILCIVLFIIGKMAPIR